MAVGRVLRSSFGCAVEMVEQWNRALWVRRVGLSAQPAQQSARGLDSHPRRRCERAAGGEAMPFALVRCDSYIHPWFSKMFTWVVLIWSVLWYLGELPWTAAAPQQSDVTAQPHGGIRLSQHPDGRHTSFNQQGLPIPGAAAAPVRSRPHAIRRARGLWAHFLTGCL